jgi:hypothetical protein
MMMVDRKMYYRPSPNRYRTGSTPDLCSVGKEVEADPGGLLQGNTPKFREAEGPNQTS